MKQQPDKSSAPGIESEALLLLASMRGERSDEERQRVLELLREPMDWNHLLRIAEHHRVMPLLYSCFSNCAPNQVPPEVLARLREAFDQNRWRNLLMLNELREVIRIFNENGLEAISFKGPLQARAVYENIALRSISDLDIYVRREDVLKTKPLLLERGYKPDKDLVSREDLEQRENEWEWGFDNPDTGIRVEIQWQTMPKYAEDYECLDESVWGRTTPVQLGGIEVRTLAAEEALLYACVHGGEKHGWWSLRFLVDMTRMFERDREVDWDRVLARATAMKKEQTLTLALYIAQAFGGVAPPEKLREKIRFSNHTAAMAGLVRGRLFRQNFGLPGYHEWLRYTQFDARSVPEQPSSAPRFAPARYLRAVLTPEFSDRAFGPNIGGALSTLAYLYRPIRLFKRHGRRLFDRLR